MSTRIFFSEELQRLRHDILAMATLVEENIGKALTALKTHNKALAKETRASDAGVNALQSKIEDDAAILIATQQPVARDLRELVTIFRITSNLERVGDHAEDLARAAQKLAKGEKSPFRAQEYLERMAEVGKKMLRASISAYLQQDAAAARKAAELDCKIDAEHKALTEDILKLMKKHPDLVKRAYQIILTSNQLERLGDHVTNICEAVVYMVEGKREELNE
jgi:phosphate transport system protein